MDHLAEETEEMRNSMKPLDLDSFHAAVKDRLEKMSPGQDVVGFIGGYVTRKGEIIVGVEGDFTLFRMDSALTKIHKQALKQYPQLELLQLMKLAKDLDL